MFLLRVLVRNGEMHAAELAKNISLSHATVTDILNRLEKRALIVRTRSLVDRRRILVKPTERAVALVEQSPPLLQEQFSEQLATLQDWELAQILSVLQRVASMMDVRQIDVSPLLAAGSVTADVSGTSFLPALVIPIPLIARARAAACKGLADQLRTFIVDEPEV